MPARIPAPKPAAPTAPPAKPVERGITREEVQDMLDRRDAAWAAHMQATVEAMLAAIPKPAPPKKPTKVKFETDARGNPVGFTITTEN